MSTRRNARQLTNTITALVLSAGLALAGASSASANRAFIVYFESDDATMSPDGMDVVLAAADFFRTACPAQKIEIIAHTDSFGPAADNLRRSVEYGWAVADALIANDVSPDLISVHAHGESQPAVATADNTREPLNRRVTIWLDAKGDKACFGE